MTLTLPLEKQLKFADWEVGAFIHYGLNVYTGQEHGDGKETPGKFNPTNLDTEQWVLAAKSMGAKYACLTARHEGGFCLWPSKTTDYTIANSPYMDGKGDIVRDFVDACRKHNIEPALYHTASHDANASLKQYEGKIGWGSERDRLVEEAFQDNNFANKYKWIQVEQMRELLTNYGPISYMWSDHWDATDPNSPWRAITELVRELQPNMVFMGPETWVPGNETGHVVYPMWNPVETKDGTNYSRPKLSDGQAEIINNFGLMEREASEGNPYGKFWRVRECTTNFGFYQGGWFWHGKLRNIPLALRLDLYYRSVGLGANTIINLPPNKEGLIDEKTVQEAKRFGDEIRRRFATPVAETTEIIKGDTVDLKWETPCLVDTVVIMENIREGQKIARYILEADVGGKMVELEPRNQQLNPHRETEVFAQNPGFETVGHKKIDRIDPITTNHIRFRCIKSEEKPISIRKLAVYYCGPLKSRSLNEKLEYFKQHFVFKHQISYSLRRFIQKIKK